MPGDMHQPSIKPAGDIIREPNFDPKTWFNGTPEEDPNVHSFLKKNSLRPKYFSQYSGFSGDNWLKVEDPDTNTLVWAYVHGLTRKNQLLVEMEGIDGRDYSRCQILPASAYNGERRAYEDKGMTIRYGAEKDLVNLKAQNLFFNNIACYPQKSSEILSDCLVQIITHRPGEGQNQWRWYPYSAVKRAVGKEAVKMLNACARREEKAIPADELIEGIGKLQLSELHPPPQGVSAAQALPNRNLSATNVYPTDSSRKHTAQFVQPSQVSSGQVLSGQVPLTQRGGQVFPNGFLSAQSNMLFQPQTLYSTFATGANTFPANSQQFPSSGSTQVQPHAPLNQNPPQPAPPHTIPPQHSPPQPIPPPQNLPQTMPLYQNPSQTMLSYSAPDPFAAAAQPVSGMSQFIQPIQSIGGQNPPLQTQYNPTVSMGVSGLPNPPDTLSYNAPWYQFYPSNQ
ncbi:hypothetical protein JX265_014013 [Neoarthrinium moseri]|uniref:Uncharacterized protein n=1 Tax=Neoarthrinium moseri TaxID=1658444 RepID=A0A9Q0AH35_9PEZI|nr:hypothetical protein JX265_014013 [Neoarthrinium moseri]